MERGDRTGWSSRESDSGCLLRWGKRKLLRRARVRDPCTSEKYRGRIGSGNDRFRFASVSSGNSHLEPDRVTGNSEAAALGSNLNETRKSSTSSSEKKDRFYLARRGSIVGLVENVKNNGGEDRGSHFPRLFITLSCKEKEEDFLTMKGCKPPLRPRKRPRAIQRSLLLVSPGTWLADMSHERYEIRGKRSKKRAKGLKAMTNNESDSE